ncbi:MAG: TfoX/Sxy family protein [Clostridia bacterium]|nr:TfoX/Sxy family protein [Clostridia bacterium]
MGTRELSDYVMDQLRDVPGVSRRAMMGGWIFYIHGRIFGGIYEPGVMVKPTPASRRALPDAEPLPPYEGAKDMLPATNLDDRAAFSEMVRAMYDELPDPKPRRRKHGV